jgi:hypothetical protein
LKQFELPHSLGRYRVTRHLASGTVTDVWLGTADGAEVVVRTLAATADQSARDAFLRTATWAKGFSHPAVPATIEVNEDPAFVVRDYVRGLTAEEMLATSVVPFRESRACTIALECAQVLSKAWEMQPSVGPVLALRHVLLAVDGRVNLLDVAYRGPVISPEAALPTDLFLFSPEHLAGTVTERSLVFTLGRGLYRLCTGVDPFAAATPMQQYTRLRQLDVTPPLEAKSGLSEHVSNVLLRALRVRDEFTTVSAFIDALRAPPESRRPVSTAKAPSSALPKALVPWSSQLAHLTRDLALVMGPWLQRLQSVLGAAPPQRHPTDGVPDGYDGVSSRGPFDRLLLSQWLLADAAPEEFIRRAAQNELLFHRLSPRRETTPKSTLVVFDSGPMQLGAPRLAHLAILMLFAQRAEAQQGLLQWGTFQGGPERVTDGFGRTQGKRLLEARSGWLPTEAHADAWETLQADSVCFIGDEVSCALAPRRRAMRIAVEQDDQMLRLSVYRPGLASTRLTLPLPESTISTRLLRNPFAEEAPAPAQIVDPPAMIESMVMATTGSHLFVRLTGGRLAFLTIGRFDATRRLTAVEIAPFGEERLMAAGWAQASRRFVTLSATLDGNLNPRRLTLRSFNKRGQQHEATHYNIPTGLRWSPEQRLSTIARFKALTSHRWVVPLAEGVIELTPQATGFTPEPVAAWWETPHALTLLTRQKDRLRVVNESSMPSVLLRLFESVGEHAVVLGPAETFGIGPSLERSNQPQLTEWYLVNLYRQQRSLIRLPSPPLAATSRSFLCSDGGTLSNHSESAQTIVFAGKSVIRAIALVDVANRIAILDQTGKVHFLEPLRDNAPIYTLERNSAGHWHLRRNVDAQVDTALRNGHFDDAVQIYAAAHRVSIEEAAAQVKAR